jgi:hypothetical protein
MPWILGGETATGSFIAREKVNWSSLSRTGQEEKEEECSS